jgi:serine/threonine protein kinase
MSPEQASGRPVDHRSDLFALGGLLYEMLTGRVPFRGDNVLDTLRRVTGEEPEPLAELRPDLPAEVAGLVERLLAKDPEDRPQNARLVADELERLRMALDPGSRRHAGAPGERRRDTDARPSWRSSPPANGRCRLRRTARPRPSRWSVRCCSSAG